MKEKKWQDFKMDLLNKNLNCDGMMNSDLWMYALSFLNAICLHTVHQEQQSFELQIFIDYAGSMIFRRCT